MSTFGDFLTVVHSLKLTLFLKEEEISDFIFSIFTNWLFSLCVCLSSIFQSAYISLLLHVSNISSYLLLKSMAVSPSLTSQAFIESRVCVCVCVCVWMGGWMDASLVPMLNQSAVERRGTGGQWELSAIIYDSPLSRAASLERADYVKATVTDILNTSFGFISISFPVPSFKLLLLWPTPFIL